MKKRKLGTQTLGSLALFASIFFGACKKDHQNDRTWSVYKADAKSSNYSPLDQINISNVSHLKPAWTFAMKDNAAGTRPSQCNPIIVDGVMYATSGSQRAYAVNAETGEQLWSFDPFDGKESGGEVNRGLTYWESGDDKRILFTANNNLFALDVHMGELIPSFGSAGKVDMRIGLRDTSEDIYVSSTSPGIIYNDLIIMGCRVPDVYGAQPGYIRAYNCFTGKLVWTFHTVPLPGEPGYETWSKDACKVVGGVNNWAGMSLDKKRGMVFLALGSPSYDFYGTDRKGENLYGNCVLALNAATGKHVWHFQTVHHDLWDYDLPAPPNLVTLKRDGKDIDAVAQITKQGFVFVFDRETGEPMFPIEERKVPASNLPGEHSSPTQPFPVKPRPFARQWVTEADLTNYSDADHDSLVKKFRSMRYEGLFTPPDLKGTLQLPGTRGGGEWGGAAFDPATNFLYIKSNDAPDLITIIKGDQAKASSESASKSGQSSQLGTIERNAHADQYLNSTGYKTWKDPGGNPAIQPPWGTLHALNLSTGEYEWQIPLGNDKARQVKGAPETGQEGKAGPIVTAGGLVFISGTDDKKLRAFDKSTGKLLWKTTLPALANATACSYQVKGKQFVALSVGGTSENPSGFIMAFALP
ncbi:pyrroloquinoline quinone-dependent dehydrogenase [Dyadobacter frigoris]|uniref:Pyrroloquinoline quinone-dependent dehydrogenase n=1 Tax=Dyadobacter frigoris TaxID=2576211 RepID=A0A4U6CTR4_9BACT|nr:pyrroloquinoline quinone-dependent dehydrogenase [Dyadobacter frigoris]TKT87982.1 pyrroloquinoline quinone-dependent dehydrogenase [Dyadobacter frigoris]GLU52880.1 quinate dehydrogenase [Dyadobacter frigoris]